MCASGVTDTCDCLRSDVRPGLICDVVRRLEEVLLDTCSSPSWFRFPSPAWCSRAEPYLIVRRKRSFEKGRATTRGVFALEPRMQGMDTHLLQTSWLTHLAMVCRTPMPLGTRLYRDLHNLDTYDGCFIGSSRSRIEWRNSLTKRDRETSVDERS
jgi:hypothetical protein